MFKSFQKVNSTRNKFVHVFAKLKMRPTEYFQSTDIDIPADKECENSEIDIQGIVWENRSVDRDYYSSIRRENYPNYFSLNPRSISIQGIQQAKQEKYFNFEEFNRGISPSHIPHFQLRHLVKCLSCTDIVYADGKKIERFCVLNHEIQNELDLSGCISLPSVLISTISCSDSGIIIAVMHFAFFFKD
jgi:hypothetical protein